MSTTAAEITTLPCFETVGARLDESALPVDMGNILGGFMLAETDISQIDFNLGTVHQQHRKLAAQILRAARWADKISEIEEGEENPFGRITEKHLDGLIARYFQVHTTYPDIHRYSSSMLLEAYDLSPAEHAHMQDVSEIYGFPSGANSVYFDPRDEQYRGGLTIKEILEGHTPEQSETATASTLGTIVFPNGYDARPQSSPSRLYLHKFWTTKPKAAIAMRNVAISRLEARA